MGGAAVAVLDVDVDAFGFVKVCMYATSAGLVFEKNFARSSGRVCINDSNNFDICLSSHVCIGVVGGKFSVVSGFVCISGIDSVGISIAFVFVRRKPTCVKPSFAEPPDTVVCQLCYKVSSQVHGDIWNMIFDEYCKQIVVR